MSQKEILEEYSRRIGKALNYISANLNAPLSLGQLASVANYSVFHFQKIFKEAIGESPSQYINRLRLENAAHSIIIHRHKSITEIALDNGFSSASTFARSFKKHFGATAEKFRNILPGSEVNLENHRQFGNEVSGNAYNKKYWEKHLKINIVRLPGTKLVCVNAPIADVPKICGAFSKAAKIAEVHDLVSPDARFSGIINPYQGLYRAGITIGNKANPPDDLSIANIEAGKFASFKIKGNISQTFHAFHAFYELWLPESGYRILNPFGLEMLAKKPLESDYHKLEREIFISIEPA